ncbi:MAG: dihydrolipoyl dehydrogenase [Planctomycetota bacterium]|nr:dihydrolipoyl dehydrogenase [Planctomycetota bacterium]
MAGDLGTKGESVNLAPRETEVAVIGAGPGGYVAAIRLGQLGKKVTVIDRDALGGVCLNYGCIPSKALIAVGNLLDKIRHASEMGIRTGEVEVDFGRLQAWKDSVVKKLTSGVGLLLAKSGVEVMHGEARFVSPHELEITNEGGSERLKAASILIATGSRPIEIPGFTIDGESILSSKEALALSEAPKRFCVIGGGVIGLEIGTFYAKLGSELSVIELMPTLLPGTAPDLVRVVARGLKKRGAKILLSAGAKSHRKTENGVEVRGEQQGKEFSIEADKVLLAVGVRPNSERLGLEEAGVQTDPRGHIVVDERLSTNVPGIHAIGDVTPGPYLAHRASKEGIIAAEAIAGLPSVLDIKALPAAIFTDPEIATVGIGEEEAKEAGRSVKVGKFPFAASGRALATGESDGFVKVIADAEDGTLLGAQIVGPEASNLIAEAALAIELGASAEDLALTVHAHPTLPESMMEAAEAAVGQAIHMVQKK